MLKIVFLASGALGYKVLKQVFSKHWVLAVLTDRNSTSIINFCEEKKIPFFAGNPRGGKASSFIEDIDCEVLLSVNYLFIVEKDLILLPSKYAINVHGSLLPKYRGRTPHVWAIINGETETGITAHLMDEKVDNGHILKQYRVAIETEDTGAMVLEKFQKLYPSLIDEILSQIVTGDLFPLAQDIAKATYFGKRTIEDGQIEWSWCKERIRNWVRAQANPYPGAFSYYNGVRIYFHKAAFSELGYSYDQQNGLIMGIEGESLLVKTPNGVIALSDIATSEPIVFEVGKILK